MLSFYILFFPPACSLITRLLPDFLPYLLHPHRTFGSPLRRPPWPLLQCCVHSGHCGLKPEALPAGTKRAAVHDTCSPNTPFCGSFHPLYPSFHHSFFQPTLLIWSPLFHLEQVIPPVGYFYTLHLLSMVLFTSSCLKPHWNPSPSDNQRHLSQQPAATWRNIQTQWMTI